MSFYEENQRLRKVIITSNWAPWTTFAFLSSLFVSRINESNAFQRTFVRLKFSMAYKVPCRLREGLKLYLPDLIFGVPTARNFHMGWKLWIWLMSICLKSDNNPTIWMYRLASRVESASSCECIWVQTSENECKWVHRLDERQPKLHSVHTSAHSRSRVEPSLDNAKCLLSDSARWSSTCYLNRSLLRS